jgi:Mrp family chromosome partitioning ATPase
MEENHLTAKYQLLRARIESDISAPAVILVTSAQPGDGKSVTASGLADCLARVGRRVVLVHDGTAQPAVGQSEGPSETASFPILSLPLESRDPSAKNGRNDTIAAFIRGLRKKYDFAIVDAAAFTRSSVPVMLAGLADGVLLTVRLGRAQSEDDQLMCGTLESAKANVLGVVAVSSATISAFQPLLAPRGEPVDLTPLRASLKRHPAADAIERDELATATVAR